MKKINLTEQEEQKYEAIKDLVDRNGNKKRVALTLGCSLRHINRMINGYKKEGKKYFVHGNRNRKPSHAIDEKTKIDIINLYDNKYHDANFSHFTELLEEYEDIKISVGAVRSMFSEAFILSPKARRITKKRYKILLKDKKKQAKTKKEINEITNKILDISDSHPRRPRCAYFGEMIQMDASVHNWFGEEKTQLHIAIDDATGTIVGAYFDTQETLHGYYNVFSQILKDYGIPYMFFTDNRTVFEYKKKNTTSVEEDTFTQFGYACKQLGVELKTSSIPQAKGRVERIFQTLQSRLPIELRLAGITTIEQANEFLNSYIQKYNAKFALYINNSSSVFENQLDEEKINLTLAVLVNRKVDSGHSIRFKKKYYKLMNPDGYPVYYTRGTSGIVIKAFNDDLYFSVEDKIYSLEEIPIHEHKSRNFDLTKPVEKPKKRYVPPANHPWRQSSFEKHLKKQGHRQQLPA